VPTRVSDIFAKLSGRSAEAFIKVGHAELGARASFRFSRPGHSVPSVRAPQDKLSHTIDDPRLSTLGRRDRYAVSISSRTYQTAAHMHWKRRSYESSATRGCSGRICTCRLQSRATALYRDLGVPTTLEQKVALANFFTIACRQSNCVPVLFTVTRSTALDWARSRQNGARQPTLCTTRGLVRLCYRGQRSACRTGRRRRALLTAQAPPAPPVPGSGTAPPATPR